VVLFNYALKELTAKIVYYGPGLSGKTTNLKYIHEELEIISKGRLLTLATETDRTLYFDFLPVEAGIVRGIKTRVQLYTVPGQVFYNATRRMVLKGADGVVFVADSQPNMIEANLESFENLRENLAAHDLELEKMPLVIQFNKRDLEDALPIEELNEKVNLLNVPFYPAVAVDGIGVEDTLRAISTLVLKSVTEKYGAAQRRGVPKSSREEEKKEKKEEVHAVSGLNLWSKEETDPFTGPQAVSAATDLVPDVVAAADWESGAESNPLETEGPAGDSPLAEIANTADALLPQDVEPEVKPPGKNDQEPPEFENLNLEGILDEALRVEDQESADEESSVEMNVEEDPVETTQESALPGVLEEALGLDAEPERSFGSNADSPFFANPSESTPDLQADVLDLGDRLEALSQTDQQTQISQPSPAARPNPLLDELSRTRIADDLEVALDIAVPSQPAETPVEIPTEEPQLTPPPQKESTSPDLFEIDTRAETTQPQDIVVPVRLTIDSNQEEMELNIKLNIKIRRK
jgi:signal recognition particle receptor subunit beta